MTYKLFLTPEDLDAIYWVGGRYCWSTEMAYLAPASEDVHPGGLTLTLEEHEAWTLNDAINADDGFLPCLSPDSNLFRELCRLQEEIV